MIPKYTSHNCGSRSPQKILSYIFSITSSSVKSQTNVNHEGKQNHSHPYSDRFIVIFRNHFHHKALFNVSDLQPIRLMSPKAHSQLPLMLLRNPVANLPRKKYTQRSQAMEMWWFGIGKRKWIKSLWRISKSGEKNRLLPGEWLVRIILTRLSREGMDEKEREGFFPQLARYSNGNF